MSWACCQGYKDKSGWHLIHKLKRRCPHQIVVQIRMHWISWCWLFNSISPVFYIISLTSMNSFMINFVSREKKWCESVKCNISNVCTGRTYHTNSRFWFDYSIHLSNTRITHAQSAWLPTWQLVCIVCSDRPTSASKWHSSEYRTFFFVNRLYILYKISGTTTKSTEQSDIIVVTVFCVIFQNKRLQN